MRLTSWSETSLVVEGMRRAVRAERKIAAVLSRSYRDVFGRPSASSIVWARVIDRIWNSDPGRVAAMAETSRLVASIEAAFVWSTNAWLTSRVRAGFELIAQQHRRKEQSVRLIGWMALAAAMTHVVLIGIDALTALWGSGFPWLAAIPLAVACIRKPQAIIAAWNSSRVARQVLRR